MNLELYTYKAKLIEVYDGDTITVEIRLGFDLTLRERVRLLGLNTPEVSGEEKVAGLAVRDYLAEAISHRPVAQSFIEERRGSHRYLVPRDGHEYFLTIKTKYDKSGKYGRILGTIFTEKPNYPDCGDRIKYWGHLFGENATVVNLNEHLLENDLAKPFMQD